MKTTFFRCPICGNIMLKMAGCTITPNCCGKPMEKLVAGVSEGSTEYHLPVIEPCGNDCLSVTIGQSPHPMLAEHFIKFIYLETEHGGVVQYLQSGERPTATFRTTDKPTAVYAYCNIHGLWKTKCVY